MPTPVRRPEDLAAVLKSARQGRGMTQDELAAKLGLHRRYVYRLESGEHTIYLDRLLAAAAELGIELHVAGQPPSSRNGDRKTRPQPGQAVPQTEQQAAAPRPRRLAGWLRRRER